MALTVVDRVDFLYIIIKYIFIPLGIKAQITVAACGDNVKPGFRRQNSGGIESVKGIILPEGLCKDDLILYCIISGIVRMIIASVHHIIDFINHRLKMSGKSPASHTSL